ncbi:hypothetical protein [Micromonospora sp. NPDC005203]|uniref:hypothetical protein n=1 Tax=Micromonospora sp. NPDC005203 TaxID=3364226 RepID=UPI00368BA89D
MVVDWGSLRAASGRASALPAAISRLDAQPGSADGEQAFQHLVGEVAPDGGLYEAAPPVAAAIVGALPGWSAAGQVRGLRVLWHICAAGAPADFIVSYRGETVPLETASHRAVQDAHVLFAALLTAAQPAVRHASMSLLSVFSVRATQAEAALSQAAEQTADPLERDELRAAIRDLHEWHEGEAQLGQVDPALVDLAARRKLTWWDEPERTRLRKPGVVRRVRARIIARLVRHLR